MGRVYKRKKRCCAMCKGHKRGKAKKLTPQQQQSRATADREIRANIGLRYQR